MRVWLKTMIKPESRRWESRSFPSPEDALLHWLSLPLSSRRGALLHEETSVSMRNPRDAEVPLGIMVTTEAMAHQLLRHRLQTEPQPNEFHSRYPRVQSIRLGGRTLSERDVLDRPALAKLREALAKEGEIPQARFRERVRPDQAPPRDPPARDRDPDVVDAEWSEVAQDGDAPVAAPPPPGVDADGYRGALAICVGLSPASGRPYGATCDEAADRFEEFMSAPHPGKARNAARAAYALLHALPRHFPSAESAGRWAMVARPAIGAFAEGAVAWAASVSHLALTHRAVEAEVPMASAPSGWAEPGSEPVDAGPCAGPQDVGGGLGEESFEQGAVGQGGVAEADGLASTEELAPETRAPVHAEGAGAGGDGAAGSDVPRQPRRGRRRVRVAKPGNPPEATGPADAPAAGPGAVEAAVGASAPDAPTERVRASQAEAPRDRAPDGRRVTAAERKVIQAMDRRVAMRKHEIAAKAGIGRGSCNRIVDRLVDIGVCLMPVPLHYVLGTGARP